MNTLFKNIIRNVLRIVFGTRKHNNDCVKKFAKDIHNKKILELGSGKSEHYSSAKFFDKSNQIIKSDVVEKYGHVVIDVTKMKYKEEFDIVLCLSVLEHLFEVEKAISNIYSALKPEGIVLIYIPCFYPLHGEPDDYWRFTEHGLRKLLKNFRIVKIKYKGMKKFPFAYYAEAIK